MYLFSVSFEESSLQRCKFQISVETVKPFGCTKQFCILRLSVSYCVSLIMVSITRQGFTNIFQTEHFSAVKFAMDDEKNYELSCDSDSRFALEEKRSIYLIKVTSHDFFSGQEKASIHHDEQFDAAITKLTLLIFFPSFILFLSF